MEKEITVIEIRDWLCAFAADPFTAFHQVPNLVYDYLRTHGYLNPDNTLAVQSWSVIDA